MTLQIFIQNGEINTATKQYVDDIVGALASSFSQIEEIADINNVRKGEWVLCISLRSYFKLWKAGKDQKVIFWFQGVEPEELQLNCVRYTLRQRVRIKFFEFLEKKALKRASLIMFVSEAMHNHFKKKHGYRKSNYIVMPCINQRFNADAFFIPGKYNTPSFVYAGGMHVWQCIEPSLKLFSAIQKEMPLATLTILTGEQDNARAMCDKLHLSNVTIKFVPLAELNEELTRYKYGFMLRDDIIVNNVATPTKFNSYLASGIIPVVTYAVHDFRPVIDSSEYIVKLNHPEAVMEGVDIIRKFESEEIDPQKVCNDFRNIFDSYYNVAAYQTKIKKMFEKTSQNDFKK